MILTTPTSAKADCKLPWPMVAVEVMSQWSNHPPELCSMSRCDSSLDFQPRVEWPLGLPAVAVNHVVLGGFHQEMVFNHQIEFSDQEKITSLFRSLYFELSFAEMSRLLSKAKNHVWFPTEKVISKFGWQTNDSFFAVAEKLLTTPVGFQAWCAEKKLGPQDLQPLLLVETTELKFLLLDILNFQLPRSMGAQALQLGCELLQMKHSPEALQSHRLLTLLPKDQGPAEAWLEALMRLRHPETERWTSLPWPGSSQAKWARHGNQGGIELKLFVSQPSDLKKYLQSLSKVQDLLEKEPSSSGTKH